MRPYPPGPAPYPVPRPRSGLGAPSPRPHGPVPRQPPRAHPPAPSPLARASSPREAPRAPPLRDLARARILGLRYLGGLARPDSIRHLLGCNPLPGHDPAEGVCRSRPLARMSARLLRECWPARMLGRLLWGPDSDTVFRSAHLLCVGIQRDEPAPAHSKSVGGPTPVPHGRRYRRMGRTGDTRPGFGWHVMPEDAPH